MGGHASARHHVRCSGGCGARPAQEGGRPRVLAARWLACTLDDVGAASFLIEDDDQIGAAAFLVVTTANGITLASRRITIGENE